MFNSNENGGNIIFNISDLNITLKQIQKFISDNKSNISPIPLLNYIIGQCNYGGQLMNNSVLLAMLKRFINSTIIHGSNNDENENRKVEKPQQVSSYADGWRVLPSSTIITGDQHVNFIMNEVPNNSHSSILNMNENSQSIQNENQTNIFIRSISSTEIRILNKEEEINQKEITATTILSNLLDLLPLPFDTIEATLRCSIKYEEAYNSLLLKEINSYNYLLFVIKNDMNTLMKINNGSINTTDALNELKRDVIHHSTVPNQWKCISYTTNSNISLIQYISNLKKRINFIKNWIKRNKPPSMIWIGGFFWVSNFLNCTLQNYARKRYYIDVNYFENFILLVKSNFILILLIFQYRIIPIDHLGWNTQVCKKTNYDSAPRNGIYIHGLSFENGKWDTHEGILVNQLKNEYISKCPILLMKPCPSEEVINKFIYKCPMYRSLNITNFSNQYKTLNYICQVQLPTKCTQEYWTERGCKLFIET